MSVKKKLKKILKKRDIGLILIIICISLILLLFYFTTQKEGTIVRVSRDNEVIDELNLNEDTVKVYKNGDEINILEIKDALADVTEANCANQICVDSPPINEVGETIACLPHGLIIEVIDK